MIRSARDVVLAIRRILVLLGEEGKKYGNNLVSGDAPDGVRLVRRMLVLLGEAGNEYGSILVSGDAAEVVERTHLLPALDLGVVSFDGDFPLANGAPDRDRKLSHILIVPLRARDGQAE